MVVQRLKGVLRAGRREAAGWGRQRRDPAPVEPDESHEDRLHDRVSAQRVRSSRSASKPAAYASGRARTRTSSGRPAPRNRGSTSVRAISRRRRLRRFRSTMRCRCLGTTSPNRGMATGEAAKKTSTWRILFRSPRLIRFRISSPAWMRELRGNRNSPGSPARGFSAGGLAALTDLLAADLDRQLGAAPATPGVEDLAASLGPHARTEAVLVGALPVPRTICGLHGRYCPCLHEW